MNNDRRRRLDYCKTLLSLVGYGALEIKEKAQHLSNLKKDIDTLSKDVSKILKELDSIQEEEGNAYSSLPQNLWGTNMAWNMEYALQAMEDGKNNITRLFDELDKLESIYLTNFMATYNPDELIVQIDALRAVVEECKENIDTAK